MNNIITFTEDTKLFILEVFDKIIDSEGCIVEKSNPVIKVLTKYGETININEFGGVYNDNGTTIFIKNDITSLIRLHTEYNLNLIK